MDYSCVLSSIDIVCDVVLGGADLEDVVQGQVTETLAGDAQGASGLLHLVGLVPGRLGVLHLGDLHVLTHTVKVLLGLLESTHVPENLEKRQEFMITMLIELNIFLWEMGMDGSMFMTDSSTERKPLLTL